MRSLTALFDGGRSEPSDATPERRRREGPRRARGEKPAGTDELARLSAEIAGVAAYVARLRREIGFLRGNDMFRDRLPSARADLDDARDGVQAAVTTILGACEKLLVRPENDPEAYRAQVESRAVQIMEACCFEDLLSQRLDRIDETLEYTTRRLQRFALAVGIGDREHPLDRRSLDDQVRREMLLEGPQAERAAPDQTSIDKLFD